MNWLKWNDRWFNLDQFRDIVVSPDGKMVTLYYASDVGPNASGSFSLKLDATKDKGKAILEHLAIVGKVLGRKTPTTPPSSPTP